MLQVLPHLGLSKGQKQCLQTQLSTVGQLSRLTEEQLQVRGGALVDVSSVRRNLLHYAKTKRGPTAAEDADDAIDGHGDGHHSNNNISSSKASGNGGVRGLDQLKQSMASMSSAELAAMQAHLASLMMEKGGAQS